MGAIDFTIRLGDIITMAGLLGGGLMVVMMQRADIRILSNRIGGVESKLSGLTDIVATQARHDERLNRMEQDVRDLTRKAAL